MMNFASSGFKESGLNSDLMAIVDLYTLRDKIIELSNRGKPMSDINYHVQCQLERGTERQTVWIPEDYAIVGNTVKLRDEEKVWHDGWKVVGTGTRLDSTTVRERGQDYKKTRGASDI